MRIAWIALATMIACNSWAQPQKSSHASGQAPPKENESSGQACGNQCSVQNALLPLAYQPEKAAREAREQAADEYNENQLQIQIRAARASEEQATAACAAAILLFVETAIAFFALCFLMRTFRETRNAAEAARDQVNISREEFRATHRPKIIIRACKLSGEGVTDDHMWPCKITYTNIGVSTAYIRKIGTRVWNGPSPWTRADREIQFYEDIGNEALKSGEDGSFLTRKDFNCDQVETIWFFAGYIEYSDMEVGGTVRKVGFIRRWMGRVGSGLGDHHWSQYGGGGNEEYEYSY